MAERFKLEGYKVLWQAPELADAPRITGREILSGIGIFGLTATVVVGARLLLSEWGNISFKVAELIGPNLSAVEQSLTYGKYLRGLG